MNNLEYGQTDSSPITVNKNLSKGGGFLIFFSQGPQNWFDAWNSENLLIPPPLLTLFTPLPIIDFWVAEGRIQEFLQRGVQHPFIGSWKPLENNRFWSRGGWAPIAPTPWICLWFCIKLISVNLFRRHIQKLPALANIIINKS